MVLTSSDGKRVIDVGAEDIWFSIYSTAEGRLGGFKKKIPKAMDFLVTKRCLADDAVETARQLNMLRDEFAKIPPEKLIYDLNDKKKKAPWSENISLVVTSCANLFTTADGGDLFFEVVGILVYAGIKEVDIS